MSATKTSSLPGLRSGLRNKLWIVLGAVIVLGFGTLFARETEKALYVRSVTGSVFSNYVVQHHLGTAEVSDDSSGFQGDFCVLHLSRPIAPGELKSETLNLMYQYHNLDGGSILSIRYAVPGTGKTQVVADAYYNAGTSTVTMQFAQNGLPKTVTEHVQWGSNDGG